ncbi:hypothetical protein AVEN_59380-1 [Araneus ventricosus]|uniref:Uncharacterized protein n=1 Tax=Araneus ventricosus TaxID=182803 RepID=A0A4Y2KFA1_ARAVE|nr:hypothetical protein AVEN_59379-1 [Araneus ventricosus]GBN01394.1 hypothetical protein AVEN_59380-1 [Araneus ventricosus]
MGDLGQETHNDISRRHEISIKKDFRNPSSGCCWRTVERFFPIENVHRERVFGFVRKWGGGQTTLDDISRLSNLSCETKIHKIGRKVEAGGLGEEFFLWGNTLNSSPASTNCDNFCSI